MNYDHLKEMFRDYLNNQGYEVLVETFDISDVEMEYLWKSPEDYYDPTSGSVHGLIDTGNCESIGRDYFEEIDKMLTEVGIYERLSLTEMVYFVWGQVMYHFEDFKSNLEKEIRDIVAVYAFESEVILEDKQVPEHTDETEYLTELGYIEIDDDLWVHSDEVDDDIVKLFTD